MQWDNNNTHQEERLGRRDVVRRRTRNENSLSGGGRSRNTNGPFRQSHVINVKTTQSDLSQLTQALRRCRHLRIDSVALKKQRSPRDYSTEIAVNAGLLQWTDFERGNRAADYVVALHVPAGAAAWAELRQIFPQKRGRLFNRHTIPRPSSKHQQSIYYPPQFYDSRKTLYFRHIPGTKRFLPQYPVYVISKGRWESRATSRALERGRVPYKLVVEPAEYAHYRAAVGDDKLLQLPSNFSDLGNGSIPARNWVLRHARRRKTGRHWILDDNIHGFLRVLECGGRRTYVDNVGAMMRAAEVCVDRYENVAQAGFHDRKFAVPAARLGPLLLNTRIYSMILLSNDIPFQWRGKHNEDTDLSLRLLKAGYCTILFHNMLMEKGKTMVEKGGNTDTVYKGEQKNRLEFAMSLQRQHPDVARVVRRYGRWHHHVDYRPFEGNKLRLKKGVRLPKPGTYNNFNMELCTRERRRAAHTT